MNIIKLNPRPEDWLIDNGFVCQSNTSHYRKIVSMFGGLINVFLAKDESGSHTWGLTIVVYTINKIYSDVIHLPLKEAVDKAHVRIQGVGM